MIIALDSPKGTRDSKFLANYAYINIADQLTRNRGIASVLVQGAGAYAMRQWVKPDQLASLGVTVPDMVKALESQNTVNPSGQVGAEPARPGQEYTYIHSDFGEYFGNVRIQAQVEIDSQLHGPIVRVE